MLGTQPSGLPPLLVPLSGHCFLRLLTFSRQDDDHPRADEQIDHN